MISLRERMKKGPVFGMAVFTGSVSVVETLGNWGFDFAYLDLEHTPICVGSEIERLIMAARLRGIPSLVRVTGPNEVEIRKVLEMGAEGVVIPHIRTRKEAEECVRAAKFPPLGRRGAESSVRAADFGGPNFNWKEYIKRSNEETLVIPMDEDFEFTDNIDEILSVTGIDAVNFGPIDYSLSLNLPIGYKTEEPQVQFAFERLIQKAQPKGIGILAPVVPPTLENIRDGISKGINMIIVGNDMYHFQNICRNIINEVIDPVKRHK